MKPENACSLLEKACGDDEDVYLPAAVLDDLALKDLPENVRLGIGELKEGVTHIDWIGVLIRSKNSLHAEVDLTWSRKYWYRPLNLEHYMDLVRRAVEKRERIRGDVKLVSYDDDGAHVQLVYEIRNLPCKTLADSYKAALKTTEELEEFAEQVSNEVGRRAAEAASRIEDWGNLPLDKLIEQVDVASTAEVECKNWSGKCGKDEFVIFRSKLSNRSERCSLGFLVSWNGFTETVTSEMLRGTRERLLIVPLEGKQIRSAVRSGEFAKLVFSAWQQAVML
ncbi:MAG: hypothetical protein ACJ8AT_29260 [Hyalangium sp.]|uniref:hypothetical protein n=1 Tax=Hyalangium sp. TaxID=2028555 RepID=UPI003899A249